MPEENKTPDPMATLRAALRDIAEKARHAADPRQPTGDMAAAWTEYFDATQPEA